MAANKLEQIYLRYHKDMLRWAGAFFPDISDREDAVSEAFLRLMPHAEQVELVNSPETAKLCQIILKNVSISILRKMKSVFRKNRMRHRCRKLGKIYAMFFLALLSTSVLTLSFSSTARAELARWFKEKLGHDTVYRFLTNPEEDYQIPRYEAGWLPEGVKLIDRVETSNGYSRIYANTDESIIIILGVDKAQTGSHLQLTQMEGYSSEIIFVEGKTIDEYYLGEKDRTLIWFEDEGRTILVLDAFLSREDALHFVKNLRKIE